MIVTNTPGSCIAAQARPTASSPGGYVFDRSVITYSSAYGSSFGLSYLGRPYSENSIAVYTNSFIDKHISAAGWSVWSTTAPQTSNVIFGEYANTGPGAWQASTQRASFATNLTATQAAQYELSAWIGDTTWLDQAAYNYVPSYSLIGTSSSSANTTIPSGSSSTSPINAHPDSGTVPLPVLLSSLQMEVTMLLLPTSLQLWHHCPMMSPTRLSSSTRVAITSRCLQSTDLVL